MKEEGKKLIPGVWALSLTVYRKLESKAFSGKVESFYFNLRSFISTSIGIFSVNPR